MLHPFIFILDGQTLLSADALITFEDPDPQDPDRTPIPLGFELRTGGGRLGDEGTLGPFIDDRARARASSRPGVVEMRLGFGIEERFKVRVRRGRDGTITLAVEIDGSWCDLDRTPVRFLVTERQWDTLGMLKGVLEP